MNGKKIIEPVFMDELNFKKMELICVELKHRYGYDRYDYKNDCWNTLDIYYDISMTKINFITDSIKDIALKLAIYYETGETGEELEEMVKELK